MQLRISRAGPAGPAVTALLALLLLGGCGDDAISPLSVSGAPGQPDLAAAVGSDPVTGATIETNKDDYVPGEVVHVEGRGWAPHETVRLHLVEEPDTHDDVTQDVVADEHGAFSTHLYDVAAHDIGVLFTLTATGLASGSVAVATFTDGTIAPGATIQMRDADCAAVVTGVPAGTPICAFATFQITGDTEAETPVQFRWVLPSGRLAGVTTREPSFPAGTSGTQTFGRTFTPTEAGSWSVRLCESTGAGGLAACSGSSERQISTFVVEPATNTPPLLDPIAEQSAEEGSPLAFTAAASDDDVPAQTLTFSLIDAPEGAAIDAATGEFTWTPADGPATATFTVRVTDSGTPALFAQREVTVEVTNAAPVITGLLPADGTLVPVMERVDLIGTYEDAGPSDKHTCETTASAIDIATVTGTAGDGAGGSCTSSLVFEHPGVYTVRYALADDDGDADTVERLVVVYDPSADFATGGGWIDSPEGAWAGDPGLTGRATFGFVSRYKKGASVPTGSAEFVFRAAGLEFHSTRHDWLVVNRDARNAHFKGAGRLNGEDGYVFMIRATDGSPDRFHITIWRGDEDADTDTVYDNGSDTVLGGGSIVIHIRK